MLLMNSSGSLDLRITKTSSTCEGGMRNWRNWGACEKQQGLREGADDYEWNVSYTYVKLPKIMNKTKKEP